MALPDGERRSRSGGSLPSRWRSPARNRSCSTVDRYAALRTSSASTPAERAASRFVALLLKKRLLSSPAAFKHTLDQHMKTLDSALHQADHGAIVHEAAAALEDEADDTAVVSGQEQEALALVAGALVDGDATQKREMPVGTRGAAASTDAAAPILDQMRALADERYRRADARATRLMD